MATWGKSFLPIITVLIAIFVQSSHVDTYQFDSSVQNNYVEHRMQQNVLKNHVKKRSIARHVRNRRANYEGDNGCQSQEETFLRQLETKKNDFLHEVCKQYLIIICCIYAVIFPNNQRYESYSDHFLVVLLIRELIAINQSN